MNTPKELLRIHETMKSLIGDDTDFEIVHSIADDLLKEALSLFQPLYSLIEDIIENYENVGKWYA